MSFVCISLQLKFMSLRVETACARCTVHGVLCYANYWHVVIFEVCLGLLEDCAPGFSVVWLQIRIERPLPIMYVNSLGISSLFPLTRICIMETQLLCLFKKAQFFFSVYQELSCFKSVPWKLNTCTDLTCGDHLFEGSASPLSLMEVTNT